MLQEQPVKPRIYVDSTASLQQAFHELIPISRAMAIKVVSYDGSELVIKAPLGPNQNHQHSAFGGSLFAVAALAGWGLMQLKLSELLLDCNTVVMGGDVSYQRPIYDDLVCHCALPDDSNTLFEQLVQKGKATTTLAACFYSDGQPAMTMNGKYHLKRRQLSAP